MLKKVFSITLLIIFLLALGCSNAPKYNKSRNGGKRVMSNGNMRK